LCGVQRSGTNQITSKSASPPGLRAGFFDARTGAAAHGNSPGYSNAWRVLPFYFAPSSLFHEIFQCPRLKNFLYFTGRAARRVIDRAEEKHTPLLSNATLSALLDQMPQITPFWKHADDLAAMLVHDCDQFVDDDVAQLVQPRRNGLNVGREGLHLDV
jgi:hypothetical protein